MVDAFCELRHLIILISDCDYYPGSGGQGWTATVCDCHLKLKQLQHYNHNIFIKIGRFMYLIIKHQFFCYSKLNFIPAPFQNQPERWYYNMAEFNLHHVLFNLHPTVGCTTGTGLYGQCKTSPILSNKQMSGRQSCEVLAMESERLQASLGNGSFFWWKHQSGFFTVYVYRRSNTDCNQHLFHCSPYYLTYKQRNTSNKVIIIT